MVVRRCSAVDIIQDAGFSILRDEYIVECANAGLPVPHEKLEMYRALDASGALYSFGAFVGTQLIGFIAVIIPELPHYGRSIAVAESLFVGAEYRKTGAGLRLIRAAEKCAKDAGSPALLISAPAQGVLEKILPRLKYTPTNVTFTKSF